MAHHGRSAVSCRLPEALGLSAMLAFTSVLALVGCGTPDAPAPTPGALAAAEAEVAALLADHRTDAGLPPLERDGELDAVARAWSRELAARGAPSHNPAYGAEIPAGWTASGENVGWADTARHPLAELPGALHEGWLDSPTHRANLDNPAFTAVGVGVAYGDDGIYVTADFAAYP